MERYKYERLPQPGQGLGDIRLVTVRKGHFDDDIRVSVTTESLQDRANAKAKQEHTVVWYALSYTWGNSDVLEDIIIEPADGQSNCAHPLQASRLLSVTPNLVDALRHLRSSVNDAVFWIDAICIDQSTEPGSLREREWQVARMHHVYTYASGVIFWLGPQADGSSAAMDAVKTLGPCIEIDWASFHLRTLVSDLPSLLEPWKNVQLQDALRSLLSRQWFDRLWIRQEAFMANDDTSVLTCGQSVVPLADFRKAIFFLERQFERQLEGSSSSSFELRHRMSLALSIFQRSYSDVASAMIRIRASDCKDARDKVYGNLGIISAASDARLGRMIEIDYNPSNSVEQTFTNFAQKYIERFGTLRILHSAGLGQSPAMRPTWAPDWRVKKHVELDLSMEAATSHCTRAECEFLPEGELKLLGCQAVRILEVYPCSELKSIKAKTKDLAFFRELEGIMKKYAASGKVENAAERITRMLCATLVGTLMEMDQIEEHRTHILRYVEHLLALSPDDEPQLIEAFLSEQVLSSFDYAIWFLGSGGLPLIFCERGYIGLGAKDTRSGDRVYSVLGCRALLVLRPTKDGKFQLVGPCSIHDLNWGEALLGPLPDGYTVVRRYVPTRQAYSPFFFNEKLQSVSMWDPRIVWSALEAHPPMVDFYQVAAPPEEPLRVQPDSDYLRRQGIQLENLNLV